MSLILYETRKRWWKIEVFILEYEWLDGGRSWENVGTEAVGRKSQDPVTCHDGPCVFCFCFFFLTNSCIYFRQREIMHKLGRGAEGERERERERQKILCGLNALHRA